MGIRVMGMKMRMGWRGVAGWVALAVLMPGLAAAGQAAGQHAKRVAKHAAEPAKAETGVKPQLVVIDTDIGDDIDDAFALALALRSPELKILGITTTFGNTELRARLLERYLTAVGRGGIPVAAGPETKTDNVMTQAAYAKGWAGKPRGDGVERMLETIRRHPGQVTLIAIGPLFTVQAAIEKDPATFRKLKRVVMMGGSIYRGYDGPNGERRPAEPEWNIDRDPAGMRALLASGVRVYMMPLDSTQIHLREVERERIFTNGGALGRQLAELTREWVEGTATHSPTPTLFDPVAVTYAMHPELCPARLMRIRVDDRGQTIPEKGRPNVEVCLKSDEAGFMRLLMGRLSLEMPDRASKGD
ncbi:MAG TPA: nucleoside hydrolase [Terracidiphilus sp.]|nr:nucleoside hydrolase [Terracidiphilus sp.]